MTSAYSKSCGYKGSPSILIQKVSFSKCSTLGSVFKKLRFRGSFYADTSVLVWTEGVSVTIKLRFQIYPAECGRVNSLQSCVGSGCCFCAYLVFNGTLKLNLLFFSSGKHIMANIFLHEKEKHKLRARFCSSLLTSHVCARVGANMLNALFWKMRNSPQKILVTNRAVFSQEKMFSNLVFTLSMRVRV